MIARIALPLFFLSSSAFAGSSTFKGTIDSIVCHADNISPICHVKVNGTPANLGCGTSSWHYTFDATTTEGQNFLSILLAAQLSGKTISLAGQGTCNLTGGSADLRHVIITTAN
ncbi:hypothetical protein CWC22_022850 [Pseudoalteromonas rubra]|uniref:Uncharacterized protein n=1 Tax=Pseudoalteromonas rubra TaxID=43658 RepID=A0A7S7YYB5_9GAMM|nr:hypothetical protein [Pseudoalteromonas rubra]QPB85842.1 hypothetical protein CWC22_022850 [Pseudoalteromonas rubra]